MVEDRLKCTLSICILDVLFNFLLFNAVIFNKIVKQIAQKLNLMLKREIRISIVNLLLKPLKIIHVTSAFAHLLWLLFLWLTLAELVVQGRGELGELVKRLLFALGLEVRILGRVTLGVI